MNSYTGPGWMMITPNELKKAKTVELHKAQNLYESDKEEIAQFDVKVTELKGYLTLADTMTLFLNSKGPNLEYQDLTDDYFDNSFNLYLEIESKITINQPYALKLNTKTLRAHLTKKLFGDVVTIYVYQNLIKLEGKETRYLQIGEVSR